MYVRVWQNGAAVEAELFDVADLKRLSVELDGVDVESAGRALADQGFGQVRDGHAWLVVERLRRSGHDDPDWNSRFAAMITFAASKNWLDATGTQVRAHITGDPGVEAPAEQK